LKALHLPDTTVTPAAEKPRPAPAAPERDEEDDGPLGCHGRLPGVRDRATAVEFRLLQGRGAWPAADYALVKHRHWDGADGSFSAEFVNGLKVTVRGWGLRAVYELFLRNRVTWLQERGKDPVRERLAREDGVICWVHAIEVALPPGGEEG
jgi:hypothetical protein